MEFEDVDMGGAVHHPNYLNFYERARHAALRDAGMSFQEMINRGNFFVIRDLQVQYLKPLFFEQKFWIASRLIDARVASIRVLQVLTLEKPMDSDLQAVQADLQKLPNCIGSCELHLAWVDSKGLRPQAIPKDIRRLLQIAS